DVGRVSHEDVHCAATSTDRVGDKQRGISEQALFAGITLAPSPTGINQHHSTPVHRQRLGFERSIGSSEVHPLSGSAPSDAATRMPLIIANSLGRPLIAHLSRQSVGRIYRSVEEVRQTEVSQAGFAQRATGASPATPGAGESTNTALAS